MDGPLLKRERSCRNLSTSKTISVARIWICGAFSLATMKVSMRGFCFRALTNYPPVSGSYRCMRWRRRRTRDRCGARPESAAARDPSPRCGVGTGQSATPRCIGQAQMTQLPFAGRQPTTNSRYDCAGLRWQHNIVYKLPSWAGRSPKLGQRKQPQHQSEKLDTRIAVVPVVRTVFVFS